MHKKLQGASRRLRRKLLPAKILRKILRAQETLFKYGTLIPRSDREAELSPEAIRWRSGRQLEWIRLSAANTFETNWTWQHVQKEYPEYRKSEIGHMFYIYDYKYSGEHRVRLVFDGSRQSPNTYNITYAPTVRAESAQLGCFTCMQSSIVGTSSSTTFHKRFYGLMQTVRFLYTLQKARWIFPVSFLNYRKCYMGVSRLRHYGITC
jgi:hypothetical protein